MTSILSSAGGIISLLDESQEELQVYALQRLNEESIIRQFWVSFTGLVSDNKSDFLFRPRLQMH